MVRTKVSMVKENAINNNSIMKKKSGEIKLGKIPLIYIVFPPLGFIVLFKNLLNYFYKKKEN